MEEKCERSPIGGIVLVAIGVLLLLSTLDVFDFHWSLFLVIFGAFFFIAALRSSDKGGVFPGTILLLIGLLFYLRYHDIIDDSFLYLWPLFPIIVGIAFFVLYIFRPKEWGLLIPGALFVFFGFIFLAHFYDLFPYNPVRLVFQYWPVILILIGVKMLFDGHRKYR